jgi:hypothetical protein
VAKIQFSNVIPKTKWYLSGNILSERGFGRIIRITWIVIKILTIILINPKSTFRKNLGQKKSGFIAESG